MNLGMNPKLMAAYLETVRSSDKKKLHDGSAISAQIVHPLIGPNACATMILDFETGDHRCNFCNVTSSDSKAIDFGCDMAGLPLLVLRVKVGS